MAMLCAVCTGAWATDLEIALNNLYQNGTKVTAKTIIDTKDNSLTFTDQNELFSIKITRKSGNQPGFYTSSGYIRFYSSDIVEVESLSGDNITGIAITKNGSTAVAVTASPGSISSETWSGSSSKVTFTGTGTNKWDKITITYEATPTFTLSAESNNTTYGTVSVENNVITATSKDGYRVSTTTPYEVTSGTATVAQSGNVFTVTATADCTVRINFEAIPSCTITYSENGVTRNVTVLEGAAIDFSAPGSVPSGYAFVGWATETISGTQATAPSLVTEATASGDATYYAVYAEAVDSDVSATFAANNITNTPAVSGETNTWRDNSTGITLKLSAGQRYTSGTPNTFTVTKGTSNYFEITTSGTLTSVVTTVSGTDYVIGSVSTGTLATDDTEQTVNSFSSASSVKCYATSSYQIRATTIVVNAVQTILENFCTTVSSKPKATITLSASDIAMVWGDTDKVLTATLTVGGVASDETITFTPSSVNLTRASNGTLSCDEPGEYTITASIAETETHQAAQAVCNVIVNKKAAALSFAETAVDGLLGEDFDAPELTNSLNAPIAYTSSTPATATVNASTGAITLVAKGTTTITATATGKYEGSASYTITVIDPNEKGTEYNPYTVAEVIDGTATGTDIYVKGFIVGEYVGKSTNPRTSDFTTDANIAIADDFTTSPTATGSIPVAMPTDALKNTWGCKTSNGTLLGYEVLIKGNKDTYFTVNGIKGTSAVTAVSVPASVTSAGFATYCSEYALDFTGKGIKAYLGSIDGKKLTFTPATTVPANTGMLLVKADGATETIPVATSASGTSCLTGVLEETELDANDYILNVVNGGAGFYKAGTNNTLGAHKAYISKTTAGEVKSFAIDLDGDETAIQIIKAVGGDAAIFNLAGQRVNRAQKGVFIQNGKKFVVK